MQFIPYPEIHKLECFLAVDCHHPKGLPLSHWRGAPCPPELMDDTSAAIVLHALEQQHPILKQSQYVSNNHFDIDGFLGVWAVLNPELALAHHELIRSMAALGDFRELDTSRADSDHALKLVCWLNTVEKEKFYPPFGAAELESTEAKLCAEKYDYFLPLFEEVIDNTDAFKSEWIEEYTQVKAHLDVMEGNKSKIRKYSDIRLMVVETPQPLHYYALFAQSTDCDMVLSIYDKHYYELEYKYTSWVDTKTRFSYPRIDLQPLTDKLNGLEEKDGIWYAEKITDTAPILRLQRKRLNKKVRYGHPTQRSFISSSISAIEMEEIIIGFFRDKLKGRERKAIWTWHELRAINK